MGKASISIAVTGSYNGSALEKAERRLDSLSKKAVAASGNLDTAGGKLVSSGIVESYKGNRGGYELARPAGEITLKDGVVEQGNFGDYAPIRIDEMPKVEVHIVQSAENPTGIGEPGVPPVAPAVANAIAAATGRWLTRLPFQADALKA